MNDTEIEKLKTRVKRIRDNSTYGVPSDSARRKYALTEARRHDRVVRRKLRNVPTSYSPDVRKRFRMQSAKAALLYYQQLAQNGITSSWTVETHTAGEHILVIARLPRTKVRWIYRWTVNVIDGTIHDAQVVVRRNVAESHKLHVIFDHYPDLLYAGWPLERIALFINLPLQELLELGRRVLLDNRFELERLRKRLLWSGRTPEEIELIAPLLPRP